MRFKVWVEQEDRKEKILKAVRETSDEFPIYLLEFVATALRVPVRWIENASWNKVVDAFYEILMVYPSVELPITRPRRASGEKEDWDYDGRTWHIYSHILASAYGWSLEYISQLQVVEALAKIQEIETDKQLNREFLHSLSEIAYPYDKSTKKNHYEPLTRPSWMNPQIKEVPRFKMPASFLPVGAVNYEALPEELRPQTSVN